MSSFPAQGASGRLDWSTERGPHRLHPLAVGAQTRLSQVGSLGHGPVEHGLGRVWPGQRRPVGVGHVRQLRRSEHADGAVGLQETRVWQADRVGRHQGDGRGGHFAARAHQREKYHFSEPFQEVRLREKSDNVTVRHGRRPGCVWALNVEPLLYLLGRELSKRTLKKNQTNNQTKNLLPIHFNGTLQEYEAEIR